MEGKKLLILGASSAIGQEYLRTSLDCYGLIIAQYNHYNDGLAQLKNELGDKLVLLQANLSSLAETKHMVESIEALSIVPDHVLHLPAKACMLRRFSQIKWEDYEDEMNISLRSLVLVLNYLLPKMAKRKSGKVVALLTIYTCENNQKYLTDYITTKYALLGLLKSLSTEYAGSGIMINGVSPDMVSTPFLKEIPELAVEMNANGRSNKRNLTVGEVSGVISFLFSKAGDAITGQNIPIYGGSVL